MRRLLTAGLGALVLSCQGPAAVLAQEATAGAASRGTAFAEVHRPRALDTLDEAET
jgi:hypothetical protein